MATVGSDYLQIAFNYLHWKTFPNHTRAVSTRASAPLNGGAAAPEPGVDVGEPVPEYRGEINY